jgi:hypothetical protein
VFRQLAKEFVASSKSFPMYGDKKVSLPVVNLIVAGDWTDFMKVLLALEERSIIVVVCNGSGIRVFSEQAVFAF